MKNVIVEVVGRSHNLTLKNGKEFEINPYERVEDIELSDSILNGIELGIISLLQYKVEEPQDKEEPVVILQKKKSEGGK